MLGPSAHSRIDDNAVDLSYLHEMEKISRGLSIGSQCICMLDYQALLKMEKNKGLVQIKIQRIHKKLSHKLH